MPSEQAWTFALVRRLLPYWRDLALGYWPRDPSAPQGYRGHQAVESGGFEHAVEAAADFGLAVRRLRDRGRLNIARAIEQRYLEGLRVPWKADELASAVLAALSHQ